MSANARRTVVAAGLLLLSACASPPPKDHPPETGHPAPNRNDAATDASFDLHALVAAPFGTLLKDSPIRLHEVLLFHDQSHGPAEIESQDCYAVDGAPPTFIGKVPDQYLMCFEHDRLERIEASVRLAADDAARDFGRACDLWLKNARPPPVPDDVCEGRDGDIAFSARLAVVPGVPGERAAELLIMLSNAAAPSADRAPPRDPAAPPSAAP